MTSHALLESFDWDGEDHVSASSQSVDFENWRLAAFEEGYKAGWDDGTTAQADQANAISDEFAKNLQELSFTYHEVHHQAQTAFSRFLSEFVAQIVPAFLQHANASSILDQLSDLALSDNASEVKLTCSDQRVEFIKRIATKEIPMPISVVTDPGLNKDEVQLTVGNETRQIDFGAVAKEIQQVLMALSHNLSEGSNDHAN